MKWFSRFWAQMRPARKYLIIGVLVASGVAAPVAVPLGGGIDEAIQSVESGE